MHPDQLVCRACVRQKPRPLDWPGELERNRRVRDLAFELLSGRHFSVIAAPCLFSSVTGRELLLLTIVVRSITDQTLEASVRYAACQK
jgi:hypothetical protein